MIGGAIPSQQFPPSPLASVAGRVKEISAIECLGTLKAIEVFQCATSN